MSPNNDFTIEVTLISDKNISKTLRTLKPYKNSKVALPFAFCPTSSPTVISPSACFNIETISFTENSSKNRSSNSMPTIPSRAGFIPETSAKSAIKSPILYPETLSFKQEIKLETISPVPLNTPLTLNPANAVNTSSGSPFASFKELFSADQVSVVSSYS